MNKPDDWYEELADDKSRRVLHAVEQHVDVKVSIQAVADKIVPSVRKDIEASTDKIGGAISAKIREVFRGY